jgi:hypothetical protein
MRVVYALSAIIILAFILQDRIAWGRDAVGTKLTTEETVNRLSNSDTTEDLGKSRSIPMESLKRIKPKDGDRLKLENQKLRQLNLLLQQKIQILNQQILQLHQELNDAGRKP